jgi:iron complex transport system permease protein
MKEQRSIFDYPITLHSSHSRFIGNSIKQSNFKCFYSMAQPSLLKKSIGFLFLLTLLFFADIALGSVSISLSDLFSSLFTYTNSSDIVWKFRLPKAITCVLAGAALATGGLLMQTLFRNPLAGPDVLGLSSGASLLVALVIMIGQTGSGLLQTLSLNPWSLVIASSLGGMMVFFLVIVIAQFVKDNTSLLIIGLMISAATASVVGVLQFISKAEDLQTFMIWSLGNVGSTNWREINVLSIVVLVGIAIAFSLMKSLNSWLLGENYARSLGVNINRSRFWIVASTGMLAGSVTAFCGPIAFVGLAVPHLVRLIVPSTNHKILLPCVMMGGSCLLLFCDMISQLPGNAQVLPLNAVTSMIGAPLVIWMVMRSKGVRH